MKTALSGLNRGKEMKNNENKMPKWKDMVPYEKGLTILSYIVAAIYLGIAIFYKFKFPGSYNLMLATVLLLSGGVCIRTRKRLAYVWFGLGLLEILLVVCNFLM